MKRTVVQVVGALLALGLFGASACKQAPSGCVPGASASCACPDGRAGAQECKDDRTFGPCRCVAPPPVPVAQPSPLTPTPTPTPADSAIDIAAVSARLREGVADAHRQTERRMDEGETFGGSEGVPCVEAIRDGRRAAVDAVERALREGVTALASSDATTACGPRRALREALTTLQNGSTQAINVDGPGSANRAHCDEPAVAIPSEVQDFARRLEARCPP